MKLRKDTRATGAAYSCGMKRVIITWAVVLACFSNPADQGLWVVSTQVVAVLHNAGDCANGSNAKIVTGAGSYCVKETPEQVIKLLQATHE